MYLIKPCPSCQRKLRFPIDKGKINVRCQCGHQFVADPDSKIIYQGATFDLKKGKQKKPRRNCSFKGLLTSVINSILGFKYSIQNFRLLPTQQQRKLVFMLLLIFILVLVLVFLLKKVFFFPVVSEQFI